MIEAGHERWGFENWDTSITILEEKLAFAGKLYCYFHTHVNAGLKLPPKLKDREGLEWARVTTRGAAKRQRWASTTWPDVQTLVQRLSRRPPHTFLHLVFSFFHSASTLGFICLFVSASVPPQ